MTRPLKYLLPGWFIFLISFDGKVKALPRAFAVGLVVDFAGVEETAHGSGEVDAVDAGFSRFVFSRKQGRRVGRANTAADVPVLGGKAAQQLEEDIVSARFLLGPVECRSTYRQEHAVLPAQGYVFCHRSVLVFLEFDLAQIVVGLFTRLS